MKYCALLFFICLSISVYAQQAIEESGVIETLTSNEDLIQVNSEAAENMAVYLKNPLDINKADEAVLLELGFLKEDQISEVLSYIRQYGPLINMLELQTIPSMNLQTFQWMQACFAVRINTDEWSLVKNIIGQDHSMLLIKYVPPIEDSTQKWEGNSDKFALRFQTVVQNKMRIGFSMEKDAGEPMRWSSSKTYYGFDNWNGYVQYFPSEKWKQITVGTYRQQFGQGLLMGGGFFAGKGSETITTLRKAGKIILPVGSTTEYGRLFGLTTTYQLSNACSITPFISQTKEDASIDTTSFSIQSISQSGYHRTAMELSHRKQVMSNLYGYHLRYERRNVSIGNTFLYRHLSHPLQPEETYYNQFYLRGTEYYGASVDLQWHYQNTMLFSEAALGYEGGKALLAGVLIALNRKADLSFLYRNYSKEYKSPYAQAFGESSMVSNEKGLYAGIKLRPKKEWSIHAYADLFVFPWLKYRVHIPGYGEEYFVRIEYKPNKKTSMYFQYRYENKYLDITNTSLTLPATRQSNILYFEHKISTALSLRTRIQWGSYSNELSTSEGKLFAQDIIYKKMKYQITFRLMWHDVENYDARQYAYEPDVPYSFSIPAYNGKAFRPFIIVRYTIIKHVDIWFKMAYIKPMMTTSEISNVVTQSMLNWNWQVRWIF